MPSSFHRLGGFRQRWSSLDELLLPASSLTQNTRNAEDMAEDDEQGGYRGAHAEPRRRRRARRRDPATYLGTSGNSPSPSRVAVIAVFSSARKLRAHRAHRRVSLSMSGACSISSTSAATSPMNPSELT